MYRYTYNLRGLYETPSLTADDETLQVEKATQVVNAVRKEGRTLLDEYESKQLLAAYGIPTARTEIARTVDEALLVAAKIGYPVVLKIYSKTITHKTDVGGVKLNL